MLNWALILVGLILGIGAGYAVWQHQAEIEQGLVAKSYFILSGEAEALEANDRIKESDLAVLEVPQKRYALLDENAVEGTEANREWLVGQVVNTPVQPGGLLLVSMFLPDPAKRFDRLIQKGMRAFTLRTDPASSADNRIGPGNRIDLYGVLTAPSGAPGTDADVLLEDVKVIAAGRATTWQEFVRRQDQGYHTVTLELTPAQARRLTYQLTHLQGPLIMALRNQCDSVEPAADCAGTPVR